MDTCRIIIISSYTPSLINFRKQLLIDFKKKGLQVYALGPEKEEKTEQALRSLGINFKRYYLKATGTNPLNDILTIINLIYIIIKIRPQYVFTYTMKPVVYGSFVSKLLSIKNCYALITGLGSQFNQQGQNSLSEKVLSFFIKHTINKNNMVFFQNPDDQSLFRTKRLLKKNTQSIIVNGSGIDISSFSFCTELPQTITFLFIARLIKEKGIHQLAEAARIIKQRYPFVKFQIIGFYYKCSNSIKTTEMDEWVKDGIFEFLGSQDDVRPYLKNCSAFVLPTYYREGTPRTILEAMSIGRAIITTKVPGAKETVIDGHNGFLIEPKSVEQLVKALEKLITSEKLIKEMGRNSRKIAEEKYDVNKVNKTITDVIFNNV